MFPVPFNLFAEANSRESVTVMPITEIMDQV